MTLLITPNDAAKWDLEADKAEEAARRYASRGMDEEVRFFTAKASDCRALADSSRLMAAPLQTAAE